MCGGQAQGRRTGREVRRAPRANPALSNCTACLQGVAHSFAGVMPQVTCWLCLALKSPWKSNKTDFQDCHCHPAPMALGPLEKGCCKADVFCSNGSERNSVLFFFLTSNLALVCPPFCHLQVFQAQGCRLPSLRTLQPSSPPRAGGLASPHEGFLHQTLPPPQGMECVCGHPFPPVEDG